MVDGCMKFLDEADDVLDGKKLIPFWRGDGQQVVNLARLFFISPKHGLSSGPEGPARGSPGRSLNRFRQIKPRTPVWPPLACPSGPSPFHSAFCVALAGRVVGINLTADRFVAPQF
jgi:hypothetical protein